MSWPNAGPMIRAEAIWATRHYTSMIVRHQSMVAHYADRAWCSLLVLQGVASRIEDSRLADDIGAAMDWFNAADRVLRAAAEGG